MDAIERVGRQVGTTRRTLLRWAFVTPAAGVLVAACGGPTGTDEGAERAAGASPDADASMPAVISVRVWRDPG